MLCTLRGFVALATLAIVSIAPTAVAEPAASAAPGSGVEPSSEGAGDHAPSASTTQTTSSSSSTPNAHKGVPGKTMALIVGGSFTAISFVAGIGAHFNVAKVNDEIRSLEVKTTGDLGRDCRDGSETAACGELAATIERRDRIAITRSLGFVVAGAFAAVTVAAFVFWPDEKPKAARVVPGAVITPTCAALSLAGSF
jgi:hypothetical protein